MEALSSTEWRVKENALHCLSQLSFNAPTQVCRSLTELLPLVTSQVWDTKVQVTHAAQQCLLAICSTITNPDVKPSLPELVNAMVKPTETLTAIDKLLATTFVAPVDAPTLAILCPILSRGLKEKLAIHKRSTCIILENMSRLVDAPASLAPFGHLLVPELKKVVHNVQFDEIRDVALSALHTLTRALGQPHAQIAQETRDQQQSILQERQQEEEQERKRALAEEEERKRWKEAMEAQRLLNQIAEQEEEEKKVEEIKKKELQKQSTKTSGGKCSSCGLKKCKKSCLFY